MFLTKYVSIIHNNTSSSEKHICLELFWLVNGADFSPDSDQNTFFYLKNQYYGLWTQTISYNLQQIFHFWENCSFNSALQYWMGFF